MKAIKVRTTLVMGLIVVMLIGMISAQDEIQVNNPPTDQQIFNSMNLFNKVQYGFAKGYYLFSSWGQANGCELYPSGPNGWAGWIHKSLLGSPATISCSKVGTKKCAIDVWYDVRGSGIGLTYQNAPSLLGGLKISLNTPPSEPNYDNYVGEFTDGSFSGSDSYWYYVEVYGCPDKAPVYTNHQTVALKCVNYNWSYIGTYSQTQPCSADTSGANLCWCSDTNSNFYIDLSGGVHCQPSSYSSVTDGTWCPSYQQFGQQSLPKPINVQKGITVDQLNSETATDLLKSICTESAQCETGTCTTLKSLKDSGAISSDKENNIITGTLNGIGIDPKAAGIGAISGLTLCAGAALIVAGTGVGIPAVPVILPLCALAGAGAGTLGSSALNEIGSAIGTRNNQKIGYCITEGGSIGWNNTLFSIGGFKITPMILAIVAGIIILLAIIFK